ncbi:MAG TPA: hypothetical protein VF462_17330 [Micromonosporaceae bacterium]
MWAAVVPAAMALTLVGAPPAQATSGAADAWNMQVVGHNDLGGRGFNADVFVYDGYAYVGSWGFQDWSGGGGNRFCPDEADSGVAVIDARRPTEPVTVAKLQNPANTSAEDVVVFTAQFGALAGHDIAVTGIQTCGSRSDTELFRGLQVWDVSDPARPAEIGRLNTGCCARGIHELEVQHRTDLGRTFVYASVPASEYPEADSPSGRRDRAGRGDFRLIDITNPTVPFEVSNWGVVHDLGGPPAAGQGCDPDPIYGHSAEPSADGKLAFLAYWDSGFIAVDVSDPEHPVYRGRTGYPANADGDAHSSSYDEGRGLLFAADEDFCKTSGSGIEKGYGYLRVYDYRNLAQPVQVGQYKTPNSLGTNDQQAGDYVIHNPLLVGTDVYASWYSDGVRVIDTSNPRDPREVAYFVPPRTNNPVSPSQRGVLTNTPQVWGVAVDEVTGLVYLSDMNSGLWIVERTDR